MINKICKFINNLTYFQLTPDVIKKSKICLLDTIGAMLSGQKLPAGKIAKNIARDNSLISSQGIFALSTLASCLDIEDGYKLAAGHPSSTVIPPILAFGASNNTKYKKIITAIVVGYEIFTRVGAIINNNYRSKAHGSGTIGAYSSAVSVGKILDLSENELKHALGLAEAYRPAAPVKLSIEDNSMSKEAIGWGAASGAISAQLAKEGFTGHNPTMGLPFDNKNKLKSLTLFSDLGNNYRINDVYIKPYACCRWAHPALDAIKYIINIYEPNSKNIEKVVIKTFEEALTLDSTFPQNEEAVQYSISLAASALIKYNRIDLAQIEPVKFNDECIEKLSKKFDLKIDSDFNDKFPQIRGAKAKFIMKDGNVYSKTVKHAKGDHNNPMSQKEVIDKFLTLTENIIKRAEANNIIKCILNENESYDLKPVYTLIKNIF